MVVVVGDFFLSCSVDPSVGWVAAVKDCGEGGGRGVEGVDGLCKLCCELCCESESYRKIPDVGMFGLLVPREGAVGVVGVVKVDFPPERVRGLGGGGLTRIDEALESNAGDAGSVIVGGIGVVFSGTVLSSTPTTP